MLRNELMEQRQRNIVMEKKQQELMDENELLNNNEKRNDEIRRNLENVVNEQRNEIKRIELSKMELIVSTSNEIQKLRDVIKQYQSN